MAALAMLLAGQAAAESSSIYFYRPTDGVRTFTDRKPHNAKYVVLRHGRPTASASCAGLNAQSMQERAASYRDLIAKYATTESVPPSLVSAVMRVESCYDARAVSRAGARGLMQLMPQTASMLGVIDSFDPEQNIRGGVRYLASMLQRFKDTRLALAAYNAGPEAVEKYKDVPPFPETTSYVKRVLKLYSSA